VIFGSGVSPSSLKQAEDPHILPPIEKPALSDEPINALIFEQDSISIGELSSSSSTILRSPPESCASPTPTSSPLPSHHSSNLSQEDIDRRAHLTRNTFLGTTSLDDFINTLAFKTSDGTTTKRDICEAFAALSAAEFKVMYNYPPRTVIDCESRMAQRKIKIGATSLYVFLSGIKFDGDEVAVLEEVMRAFRKAAAWEDGVSGKVVWALRIELEVSF
jgi:hypothetical protein